MCFRLLFLLFSLFLVDSICFYFTSIYSFFFFFFFGFFSSVFYFIYIFCLLVDVVAYCCCWLLCVIEYYSLYELVAQHHTLILSHSLSTFRLCSFFSILIIIVVISSSHIRAYTTRVLICIAFLFSFFLQMKTWCPGSGSRRKPYIIEKSVYQVPKFLNHYFSCRRKYNQIESTKKIFVRKIKPHTQHPINLLVVRLVLSCIVLIIWHSNQRRSKRKKNMNFISQRVSNTHSIKRRL